VNGEEIVEIGSLAGDTPLMLVIETGLETGNIGIDLDTPWTRTHADLLREPGTWWLIDKESGSPVMALVVEPGDQPYFVKHHVGAIGDTHRELIAYGMGKKRPDGSMVRSWLLPNGVVCGGDDVDIIASRMLNQ
jgi:hypothetical protein